MPYQTKVTYTGNGSNQLFNIPFPYLDRLDILVRVSGVRVTTGLTFVSDQQVRITPTPPNGSKVTINRATPFSAPRVTFKDGSVLRSKDLNDTIAQSLYVIQETMDRVTTVEGTSIGGGNTPSGIGPDLPEPDEANTVPVYDGDNWVYYNGTQFKAALSLGNDYIRATQRTTYNTSLGSYPTGESWIVRGFTHIETDDTGLATLNSGKLTLPAGKYRVRAVAYWNIETHIALRLKNEAGQILLGPRATYSDRSTSNAAVLDGQITLAGSIGLTLETAAAGFDESPGAQGIAHGIQSWGDNVFTVLELWKVA